MDNNYFSVLNSVNVGDKIEKKGNLNYLSWAWAWGEVKKRHPDAIYTIYENKDGWIYHTDGKTCWVKTGVTVNGIEHIECLPVMDNRNNPIHLEKVTSFHVNTAIQRSLTKACARHGLGLYIYAGEDLPEDEFGLPWKSESEEREKPVPYRNDLFCEVCGCEILDYTSPKGVKTSAWDMAVKSVNAYGKQMCAACALEAGKAAKGE